jgi:hypothetical protein
LHVDTGLRRIRNAYNELPRKNGKSLEDAIMALYITFFDDEPGAEGYCAATKRDQAKIVFGDAKRLVKSSKLRGRIRVLANNLHRESLAQKLEPLGFDAVGATASCADGDAKRVRPLQHRQQQRPARDCREARRGAAEESTEAAGQRVGEMEGMLDVSFLGHEAPVRRCLRSCALAVVSSVQDYLREHGATRWRRMASREAGRHLLLDAIHFVASPR